MAHLALAADRRVLEGTWRERDESGELRIELGEEEGSA
jgi:hypothetical protein